MPLLYCLRHIMLQLKTTAKVRKFVGIKDSELVEKVTDSSALGAWYVNLFFIERRKALIFMNERTLLSFIIYGVRKDNTKSLPAVLCRGLHQLLSFADVEPAFINRAIADYEHYCYSKTDSKSSLGNMNDLVFLYQHHIQYEGGLQQCDLTDITFKVNQTPQRNIGWDFSLDLAISLIENETAI